MSGKKEVDNRERESWWSNRKGCSDGHKVNRGTELEREEGTRKEWARVSGENFS